MVVCCVGHTLLLAAGVGGIGALIGAATGNRLLLIGAGALLVVTVATVVLRLRRRSGTSALDIGKDSADARPEDQPRPRRHG